MDQLARYWVEGFWSWNTPAFVIAGFAIGLLNIKFDLVNRDEFFSKLVYWYCIAAALIAVPLVAGYAFGANAMFISALPIFAFGLVLLLFKHSIVSFVFGLLLATILRDVYFEA
jgi:polyferredoxin